MFVTVHAAAGAAIASSIPSPIISFPLAFGSHFLLDAVPHVTDTHTEQKMGHKIYLMAGVDLLIASIVTVILVRHTSDSLLFWGAVSGSIMDTDAFWFRLSGKRGWRRLWPRQISKIHANIQNEIKTLKGVITQVLILIVSVIIIVNYG